MSETIKEYWNEDAIRLVFKHFDEKELRNACLVCNVNLLNLKNRVKNAIIFNDNRSWWKIGKSVIKERGPLCRTMIRKKAEKKLKFLYRIRTMIKYLIANPFKMPSICMFMSNDEDKYDNSERCYCTKLPSDCYSMWIESISSKNTFFTLSTAIFPSTLHIQVNTYTFNCKYSPNRFSCAEIQNLYDVEFFKGYHIKSYFDEFFQIESPSKYFLILWCRPTRLNVLKNIIKNLVKWYSTSEILIWGGVADRLIVCNKKVSKYICRSSADIVFLFTKARHMEVKSLLLDQNCVIRKLIARKFRVLSENTTLKEHSVAFMYTSYSRFDKCHKLESLLFKQYFPSVPLFHTVGKETLGATGLNELFQRMQLPEFGGNSMHTALMLLTFN